MSKNYEKLSVEDFGAHLLSSGDLDPIYAGLAGLRGTRNFDDNKLCRWLIAYWSFYHAGLSSYLSEYEGKHFWTEFAKATANKVETPIGGRWPRGKERRHFRGDLALKSGMGLWAKYGNKPEQFVDFVTNDWAPAGLSFAEVTKRVQKHSGFGPWIGFKIADMLERVCDFPVQFEDAEIFMFKDPEKAAFMLYEERYGINETPREKVLKTVTAYLQYHFRNEDAPPIVRGANRKVNIQEIETILCKWKSHVRGHYPLFNDIQEIRTATEPWATVSPTAAAFLEHFPKYPK